ncbi:MAG: hypothetical protein NWR60_07960 [Candidatus Nanopelagicales bacterium]|nr:hypothetical protein [Candidatus Nanopelagicales bacterium]
MVAITPGLGFQVIQDDPQTRARTGGFQVLSLGVGFKNTLAMEATAQHDDVIADGKQRFAHTENR